MEETKYITKKLLLMLILPICLLGGCENKGDMIQVLDKTLYYPKSYGKDNAEKLFNYLSKDCGENYYNANRKEIRLQYENNTWTLKVPIRKGEEQDEIANNEWKFATIYLSDYVTKPDIELSDDKFHTLKVIKNATDELGKPRVGENSILYVLSPLTDNEAEKLSEYLDNYAKKRFHNGEFLTAQIRKDGNTYSLGLVVKEGLVDDDKSIANAQVLGIKVSNKVFDGQNVDIRHMDRNFKTLRTYLFDKRYETL